MPAAASFLDSVPSILAYGAYGLAVLLMFLGYSALRALMKSPHPRKQLFWLVGLFLCLSLGFLGVAGLLQKRPVKISIVITPWRDDAVAALRLRGTQIDLGPGKGTGVIDIGENESVNVDIDPVVSKLMRCQILADEQLKLATRSTPEQGVANGL